MLTAHENELLTRTGPGTAMGRVFRRYWMPALLSRELERDGAPVRIRILGEDYIAFRDTRGRVGVVDPRCPHRGANLFFGRNEDCGLRCVYHGWKFDHAGRCVEIPTVPAVVAERLQPRAAIRALHVREWGDVVWVHFGDGAPPELPQFEFATVPASHRFVSKKLQQCNWAQACEGGIDTAHFSFLHAGVRDGAKVSLLETLPGARRAEPGTPEPPQVASFRWMVADAMPQFTVIDHAAGLVIGASRHTDDDTLYWRVTQFLMPNHSLAPGSWPGGMLLGNTWVPIDDESCWIYCYAWNPDRPLAEEERARLAAGSGIFAAVDANYVPLRNRDNDYLIDRALQKRSSYTGITGISEQDAAVADSQGLIADRTHELLGQTDLAVVRFRRLMLDAVAVTARGETPRGVLAPSAYRLRSGDLLAAPTIALTEALDRRFGALWGVRGG